VTDNLVQLLGRHHRCGVITIACECGWFPDDHLPGDRQYEQYDEHLATVFRQYRFNLPVITQAPGQDDEYGHVGRVPGVPRPYRHSPQAKAARARLEALNAAAVREEDAAIDRFMPGVDDVPDWVREGLDR
jgi:hypothetical protein